MPLGLTLSLPTAGVSPLGDGGQATDATVLMASRLYCPGWSGGGLSNGTHTVQNARTQHYNESGQDVAAVRLLFANWFATGVAEQDGPNPITVRASIEYPANTLTPLHDIDGVSRDTVIAPGGLNELAGEVAIPAGAQFWVRTRVIVGGGERWPTSYIQDSGLGVQCEQGTDGDDKTTSGAISGSATGYGPAAILGRGSAGPAKVRLAVMGDSIPAAAGDNVSDGHGNYGYFGKALTGRAPGLATSVGGSTAEANATNGVLVRRLRLMRDAGVTHVIVTWSTNDLGSRTLGQLQADLTAIWAAIADAGMTPVQTTCTPRSSSTDAWATTTNQTAQFMPLRADLNDWIRSTPAPLGSYVELADSVESGRNSGKWAAAGGASSGDGVHPNPAGHLRMRDALTTWIETVAAATASAPGEHANIAPVILSSSSETVAEGEAARFTLVADKSVIFSKGGGGDAALFSLAGRSVDLPAQDFGTPADANGDNVYEVTFTATDRAGATAVQAFSATVQAVADLEPETESYIGRMATPPNETLSNDLNNLVLALKDGALSGVNLLADRFDTIQIYGLDDSTDALLDLKGYADAGLTGGLAFAPNQGFTVSGSGVGIRTNFNPNAAETDGRNFSAADGHVSVWIGAELGTSNHDIQADDGGSGAIQLSSRYTNNFAQFAFSADGLATASGVTASVGWWLVSRGGGAANQFFAYQNGVERANNFAIVSAPPDFGLGVGASFDGSSFGGGTGRRYALFTAGRRFESAHERMDAFNAFAAFAAARGW